VTDRRGGRARLLLVTAEMTVAFVVVVAMGLMVRTYSHLTSLNLGFRSDHVLTMRIALPESKYRDSAEVVNFVQDLANRVRSLPGVTDLAFASAHPLGRQAFRDFTIPGRPLSSAGGLANAAYRIVSPGYFTTIRTPLREGRHFSENDGPSSANVALVNESFARKWFPEQDAVGKEIQLHGSYGRDASFGPENEPLQIVGVVGNSKHVEWGRVQDLEETPTPEIYVPVRQHATRDMALLLRTNSDPSVLTDAVRQQVLSIDSDQPVYDVETLQEAAAEALGPVRLAVVLLGGFGSMALLIASVGLYAVLAYSVAQRTQEIGIRMALGARPMEILRLVVRQGLTWAGSGLGLGILVAIGLTRLMSSLLYGVSANDAKTFVAVAAVLVTVALIASIVPAIRAAKVDPMVALRYE
jgi:putative ABC transport system permease protein